MITAKVLVSSQTATRPPEALRPVVEKILPIAIILLVKPLFVVLNFLNRSPTPAKVHIELLVVEVPGDELEGSLVNATILACSISVIPFSCFLAVGFVGWPVVALASFVLSDVRELADIMGCQWLETGARSIEDPCTCHSV